MRKIILYLLIIVNTAYAQECLNDISSVKFLEGFPHGYLVVQSSQDFNDPYLVRWNSNKTDGEPIYLLDFDTQWYIPDELIGHESEINSLFIQAISSWNNNYNLQLEIDNGQKGILFGFAENENLFIDPVSGGVASAVTHFPIMQNPLSHQFECFEFTENSLTEFSDAFVLFNSDSASGITWTTSTIPDGGDMLGTVILHEMGHVLTLGHSTYIIGYTPRIMDRNYDPKNVVPNLTTCDKSNAASHSDQLYGLVVSISNGINITSFPSLIDENQQYSLYAEFYKGDPNSTDHVLSWNWIIKLYHSSGTFEYVNETFSGSSYWYSCPWTLNTTALPSGYSWTLNTSGHIATDIVLSAQIAGDGVSPVTKIISFDTAPTQPQNLTIAWYNNHPKLTWDTNLEDDISSYKIWKNAEGSSTIAATITHNPSNNTHSWIDYNVTRSGKFGGFQYNYKVKAVDNTNKESIYSNMVSIWGNGGLWKINNLNDVNITTYKLQSNYPNPFNPSTKIEFQIPNPSFVNLTVYNSLGEEVTTLVNQNLEKGKYTFEFNAENLPSGIYIYKLNADKYSAVRKMMLVK